MKVSLVEVAGANFRADEESDLLNTAFMKRLGMRKRYLPARLAIARSLSVPSLPPPVPDTADPGKAIKGDTLFDTGGTMLCWLALIVERAGDQELDLKKLIALVSAHWRRGIGLLDQEWMQADQDLSRFIRRLVDVAELPSTGHGGANAPTCLGETFSTGVISVPIGEVAEEVSSGEKVLWNLNGPGGSPHGAMMGGVGSGKTRTAVAALRSIREQAAIPLLAFDFKGDLGTNPSGGGYHLDAVFQAQTIEPPRQAVPLNVFAISSRDDIAITEAALRFRESFRRLKGSRVGDRQRDALHEAATRALSNKDVCELHHVRDALIQVYEEREMREDGAIATMREICRFPLFSPEFEPASFFRRSWIVKLPPNISEDSRTIVVNLILDALDQYLNSLIDAPVSDDGSRGLRIICMVDEAHQILGTKLPALSNLVRMSRSKGGAMMLISQSPDDFAGEDDDFLSEMGLVTAFATNAPPRNAARVLGRGANLGTLQTGQCYIKRRGDPGAKKIKAWEV